MTDAHRFRPGDRVTLTVHGRVMSERSGFVRVQWDAGEPSTVWALDLAPETADERKAA
jgi:hypothetical protein